MCAFDVGWGSGNRVQVISASGALWACGWPFPSAVSGRFPVSNGEPAGFLKFFCCWLAMPTGARSPLWAPPVEGPVGPSFSRGRPWRRSGWRRS
jgi:hypothetical protein